MRILALFGDGNGSVKKALPEHDVVSVGIGNADIIMDLSDLGNVKKLVNMHKKEPFDLLMASPPCESWSFATAVPGEMRIGIKKRCNCDLLKIGSNSNTHQ